MLIRDYWAGDQHLLDSTPPPSDKNKPANRKKAAKLQNGGDDNTTYLGTCSRTGA